MAVLFAALGACDSGPTDGGRSTPGTLTASLTSANATDVAILVQLDGVGTSNVVVSGEGRILYERSVSPTRRLIAVFGPLSAGVLFRFDVPDTRQSVRYAATVIEVSNEANVLRTASQYSVQIAR